MQVCVACLLPPGVPLICPRCRTPLTLPRIPNHLQTVRAQTAARGVSSWLGDTAWGCTLGAASEGPLSRLWPVGPAATLEQRQRVLSHSIHGPRAQCDGCAGTAARQPPGCRARVPVERFAGLGADAMRDLFPRSSVHCRQPQKPQSNPPLPSRPRRWPPSPPAPAAASSCAPPPPPPSRARTSPSSSRRARCPSTPSATRPPSRARSSP